MIYYIGKNVYNSPNILYSSLEEMYDYFSDKKEIGVDTETTGLDPLTSDILSIQLGTYERQYVIETAYIKVESLKHLLEDPSKVFILQNSKFDIKFFYKHNINFNTIYDTFLAEAILTTGFKVKGLTSLKTIVKSYCDYDLDKSVRKDIYLGLTERGVIYAAEDVKFLAQIKEKQLLKINELKLNDILQLELDAVKVFAKMEFVGIALDTSSWSGIIKANRSKLVEIKNSLDEALIEDSRLSKFIPSAYQQDLFGFPIRRVEVNWASPQQKVEILNALGIKCSTSGDPLLQSHKNEKLVKLLIQYNKYSKLLNAFGENYLKLVNKVSKRIHMDIWQILVTGRIATSTPNLNQIPNPGKSEIGAKIRACFIPQKGYKMVGGDYSQCELRLLAEFSQDPVWIKAFNDGVDLHTTLACLTFGITPEDVKKPFPKNPSTTYRDIQKTINFG